MARVKIITAEYSRFGYAVLLNGQEIYMAGNSPQDSKYHVPPEQGIGLRKLRRFAISTARELATEKKAKYAGVTRVSREYEA